jgi:hypothetical protein
MLIALTVGANLQEMEGRKENMKHLYDSLHYLGEERVAMP